MVNITPIDLWHEGAVKTVSKLEVASSYDDLNSYATFVYRMIEVTPGLAVPEGTPPSPDTYVTIASGTVFIGGQDYIDWDNSNDAAYAFVADRLNLTIAAQ